MEFFLQIVVILACLFYGARKGGVALGLLGGIGIVVMVFAFDLPPGKPPVDVMLTIVAVVAASATLQASGGLDVLLQLAEKLLRRNPKYVSILAPFTTCTLTMLCGTGHVVYTMLPIIYDVAIKNNIRPERPMAASSIAQPDGHHRQPGVGRGGVAGRLPRQGAGRQPGHRLRHAAVGHDPVHAGRRADDRHLQLVPRQGPRQGRGLPGADRRSRRAQVRLRRIDDAARQEADARPVDRDVDLRRRDRRGGARSARSSRCGRWSAASRCRWC